jgi:CBS domain-containing protein
MRSSEIMTTPVVTVRPNLALKEVAAVLVEHRINGVPVVDASGNLVGIVTEGDLLRLEAEPDPRRHEIRMSGRARALPSVVSDVMTRDVRVAIEDTDVAEIARLMLEHHVKTVPIVSGDRVVGIVARRDLLQVIARSDEDIEADVRDLLDDEMLMLGRYEARVQGGVVILSGAAGQASRRLAELLTRSVPGVIAVRFGERQPLR